MKYPNLDEEKKLWKQGIGFVVGVDEAGRGPLAGPVVAGAVLLPKNFKIIKKNYRFKKTFRETKGRVV